MTNDKARRASGKAMQDARRSGGKAMQDSRRAGGDAMIERRTGKSQVDEINSVVVQPKARKTLKAISPRGPLPAQASPGTDTPNPKPTGGGGIASPLTEQNYALREYWPNGEYSNDGLLTLPAAKKLVLTDADGAEVIINLAQPV
jgi:hypothetical protein